MFPARIRFVGVILFAAFFGAAGSTGPSGRLGLSASKPGGLRLWYRQPAAEWKDGLPIGNGVLAGMVLGGVERERVALNHELLWRDEHRNRDIAFARGVGCGRLAHHPFTQRIDDVEMLGQFTKKGRG